MGSHHGGLGIVEKCQSYERKTFKKNDSLVNYLPTAIEKESVTIESGKNKKIKDSPTKIIFVYTKDFYGWRCISCLAELQTPFPPSTLVTVWPGCRRRFLFLPLYCPLSLNPEFQKPLPSEVSNIKNLLPTSLQKCYVRN